jgi:hypothetical protein
MYPQFSTIIPSTILPLANPDAPNSSKQGRIVEEFWKNCRKILRALVRQRLGEELWKNCRKILRALVRQRHGEELWKNRPVAKSFYNVSTILLKKKLKKKGKAGNAHEE